MALSYALRGLIQQGSSLLGLQHAAASVGISALQRRTASSHAENTNTFLREVNEGVLCTHTAAAATKPSVSAADCAGSAPQQLGSPDAVHLLVASSRQKLSNLGSTA